MSEKDTAMQMTVSALYLTAQLDTLNKLGFSHAQSLKALNFNQTALSNPQTRIHIDTVLNLYNTAEKVLNDPYIGLRVGFKFRSGNYAQTGAIYGYCQNLLQVIEMNGRYQRLAIDVGEIKYQIKNADAPERHCMHLVTYFEDHDHYRHITDLVMGAYGTTYRWLSWGTGGEIEAVHLPYEKPDDTTLHQQVFQCPVLFGQSMASMEYGAEMMTAKLTTHDPEKLAIAIAKLDKILGRAHSEASLKTAIETAMRSALITGTINAAILAERLNRPERQLRADMKAAMLTYRGLLDSVRQGMFLELHRKGESFATIAQSLAYNDQAAFTRAFKRWYGVPPGQWKDESFK